MFHFEPSLIRYLIVSHHLFTDPETANAVLTFLSRWRSILVRASVSPPGHTAVGRPSVSKPGNKNLNEHPGLQQFDWFLDESSFKKNGTHDGRKRYMMLPWRRNTTIYILPDVLLKTAACYVIWTIVMEGQIWMSICHLFPSLVISICSSICALKV